MGDGAGLGQGAVEVSGSVTDVNTLYLNLNGLIDVSGSGKLIIREEGYYGYVLGKASQGLIPVVRQLD